MKKLIQVLLLVSWLTTVIAAAVGAHGPQDGAITITSICVVTNGLRISWEGGIAPYKLQSSNGRVDSNWDDISFHIYAQSYVVTNTRPQAYFRVRSIPDQMPPPPLRGFGPRQVDCDKILFTWDAPQPDIAGGTGLRGTRIYRDGVFLVEIPVPRAVFIDTTVSGAAAYYYWASSVDAAGNESPRSGLRAVETPPCDPAPGLSVTLAWNANPESVTVAWNANPGPDIAGYIVRYGFAVGNYSMQIDVGNVTTRTVWGLLPASSYYFVVSAYNVAGLEGGFSNEVGYYTP